MWRVPFASGSLPEGLNLPERVEMKAQAVPRKWERRLFEDVRAHWNKCLQSELVSLLIPGGAPSRVGLYVNPDVLVRRRRGKLQDQVNGHWIMALQRPSHCVFASYLPREEFRR